MEKAEKIQMISEDLARNPEEVQDIKQDVGSWSDNDIDGYIYENFQHGRNDEYEQE